MTFQNALLILEFGPRVKGDTCSHFYIKKENEELEL